jgi:NitT/TauT family transport system substrate-binding protein
MVVLLAFSALFACNQANKPSVIVPSGSPQLALIYLEASNEYLVDIIQGADPLIAAFGSLSHDFIFAPTNLGAKLYAAKPDYVLLAAVTFGNYYLVTKTNSVFDIEYLRNREITVFGANQTSDIILRYILEQNDVVYESEYVDSVLTATSLFIQDQSKVVLIAEPSLAVLKNQIEDIDIIDLQAEYETITGNNAYPQAGVFGKTSLESNVITAFLTTLADSIAMVNNDPDSASDQAITLGYAYSKSVMIEAIPRSNLGFQSAIDVKSELEAYFSIILAMNPELIGGSLPEEAFYYQP